MMSDYKNYPTLLALDASDSACSIAVQFYHPGLESVVVDSIILEDTLTQSSYMLASIESILKNNELNLAEIDALVFANGPGRFTGLRLAASCIQGLAYGLNKPVITLNSLQLQAQQLVTLSHDMLALHGQIIWVCQKAYAGFYYHAQFTFSAGELIEIPSSTGYLISENDLMEGVIISSADTRHFVGSGWADLAKKHSRFDCAMIHAIIIDIKYGFALANQYYIDNKMSRPELVEIVYAVNPYSQIN